MAPVPPQFAYFACRALTEALGAIRRAWNRRVTSLDCRYNGSYTSTMKTAISIPDPIFQAAEQAAEQLSMSRSELYARAVEEFVNAHCHANVTEKLNQVYSESPSALDSVVAEMQSLSLDTSPW